VVVPAELADMNVSTKRGPVIRLRSIRAKCAARDGDFDLARKDIDFVKNFPTWDSAAIHLEASLLVEQKKPIDALAMLDRLPSKGPEDSLLYARAVQSELPETPLSERAELRRRATEIRTEYNFALEYDFGDSE